MNRQARRRRLLVDALEPRTLFASVANKVADINQGSLMLNPQYYTPLGTSAITLFTASSYHGDGAELWRTDGTAAGTKRVKDIRPGIDSSNPNNLVNLNGTVFFTADDGTNGTELWKSDGTEAGTVMVKDIAAGSTASSPAFLTPVGTKLYFAAAGGIWTTDGTSASTARVGTTNYTFATTKPFAAIGSTVYFGATAGATSGLYKTDGTAAGTLLLKSFESGQPPRKLAVFNGKVYFNANQDSLNRGDLWTSDGTAAGTVMVKAIGTANYSSVSKLTPSGSYLYFAAGELLTGKYTLYRSDGTTAGTIPLGADTLIDRYTNFTALGGTSSILFPGRTTALGSELYRSDGTGAPTIVKEILPGTGDGATGAPLRLGSNYLFGGGRADGTYDLWKTDGTAAGTTRIFDTGGNIFWSFGAGANSTLFLSLTFAAGLGELWKSDATTAGTVRVGTSNAIGNGSSMSDYWPSTNNAQAFTKWGSTKVLYAADDGIHGSEVWVTDSQTGVTQMIADVNPGIGSSDPNGFTVASDGSVLFQAKRSDTGREVFRMLANGTVQLVEDIAVGLGDSYPARFAAFGTSVYYLARPTENDPKYLYRYDVTTQTNTVVRDAANARLTTNAPLMFAGTLALFGAAPETNSSSQGLYSLASAGAIPTRLKTLSVDWGTYSSLWAVLGTTLYFVASDGTTGYELWKTDGTPAGTTIVKDIHPGSGSAEIDELIAVNGKIYFGAGAVDDTTTLWSSDGTAAGTTQYDATVNFPTSLSKVNNDLYFVGVENGLNNVFRTDGSGNTTTTGALRPQMINVTADFKPVSTYSANFMLFYVVDDRTGPTEQYKLYSYLPGNSASTFVKDLWQRNPYDVTMGIWGVGRIAFLATNNRLFFPAFRQEWGTEPHSYVLDTIATLITGNVYYDKNKNGVFNQGVDAVVSGFGVYVDLDNDGVRDSDEPTFITNAAGNYEIRNLDNGTYVIRPLLSAGQTSNLASVTGSVGSTPIVPAAMAIVDTLVPTIASMTFDRDAPRLRVRVVFTDDIDPATLSASDLILTLRPSGAGVSMSGNSVAYDAATKTASFTFPAYASGILPNGRYHALITIGSIADGYGNAIPAAGQLDFDFMRGDLTGDGVVNFNDLIVLAQNYGKTGQSFSQGNLDYDAAGTVNFDDLIILAQAYNTALPALVAATSAAKKPSSRMSVASQLSI